MTVHTILIKLLTLHTLTPLSISRIHFAPRTLISSRASQTRLIELAALQTRLVLEEVLTGDASGAVVDTCAGVASWHGCCAVFAVVVGDVELGVALEAGLLGAVEALIVVDGAGGAGVFG